MTPTFEAMGFLFPAFLFALFALAIPVLIHLLRFRPTQTLKFSDIRFLESVMAETSRMKSIRNWLILLLRMLAVAALVMAFAQPFWNSSAGEKPESKEKEFTIYLDPSLSMGYAEAKQPLYYQALESLGDWLSQLPEDVQISLVEPSGYISRPMRPSQALQHFNQQETMLSAPKVEEVVQRWKAEGAKGQLVLISDFQYAGLGKMLDDSVSEQIVLLPIQPSRNPANLRIDSVWSNSPFFLEGLQQTLFVQISNSGETDIDTRIQLLQEGKVQLFQQIQVPARGHLQMPLNFTPSGSLSAVIQVDDQGFQFDNRFYISGSASKKSKVWIWDEGAPQLDWGKLMDDNDFEKVLYKGDAQEEALLQADLLVLADWRSSNTALLSWVREAVTNGTTALIWPSVEADLPAFLSINQTESGLDTGRFSGVRLAEEHPLFKGVFRDLPKNIDLPVDQKRRRLEGNRAFYSLIQYEDDYPQLAEFQIGEGSAFVFAAALDRSWSNWQNEPLLLPIVLNASWLRQSNEALFLRAIPGYAWRFSLPETSSDAPIHLLQEGTDLIPLQHIQGSKAEINYTSAITQAGLYALRWEKDTLAYLAVNPSLSESTVQYLQTADLPSGWAERVGNWKSLTKFSSLESDAALWPWLIGLAIIFLLLESALSRFVFTRNSKV